MHYADFGSFCAQVGLLAGWVLGLLLLLGVAGMGWVVWLPRFGKVRWAVFAPIAGLAIITLLSLPLSLLGLPVERYAWPLLLVLAAFSSGSMLIVRRTTGAVRRRRLCRAYLRRCGLWLGAAGVIVVLLSARMLTYGGNGRIDGAWGSTDFGAYWIVADYLQHNGADAARYEAQNQFRASDIEEHLFLHARLGCMTTVAILGHALAPGRLPAILNPLLVASLVLLVALVQVFAQREHLWPSLAVLAVVFHPFLYFLLFYTYLCQAFSVILIAAGLLVAEIGARQTGAGAWPREFIAAGLLFAAAILQYASAFFAPAIFLVGVALLRTRQRGLAKALVCGGTLLLVAGYHLPRSIRELAWLGQLRVMPGWDWQRLVNVHEFLGLRSLIRYEALPPGDFLGTIVTVAITALVGIALLNHLRRGALPLSAGAMLVSTLSMAVFACLKHWQGVPNATHGLAKVMSQYVLLLLIFVLAGATATFAAQRRRVQSVMLVVVGALGLIQLLQVAYWRRAPWFDYDLIALVERHRESNMPAAFDPNLDDRLVAPLIRDRRRLAENDRPGPRLRFTVAPQTSGSPQSTVVDRQGAYLALHQR